MYSDIPLWLSLLFIAGGLAALAWSSDAFVDGAATVARRLGISPFIVGMVIIGFGTCAPEFFVSVFSGASGHSNLSLGNAFGSCLFNILGVLGIAALVRPIPVKTIITFLASPLMALTSLLALFLLLDGTLSKVEAAALLAVFLVVMPGYCWCDQKKGGSDSGAEAAPAEKASAWRMLFNLVVGFSVMVGASHLLVWGSVDLARTMGVGELMIGLTIVAIGTSVPELATAIQSARKGENELVLGNIVGSNLFNTLVVVGTAGVLSPEPVAGFSRYVITRDLPLLVVVSAMVGLFGLNWRNVRKSGVITRLEGGIWVFAFLAYTALMLYQEVFSK